jgi:putative transposase
MSLCRASACITRTLMPLSASSVKNCRLPLCELAPLMPARGAGRDTNLAIRALDMAVALRQPPKGCIHHTDRGSQYCSNDYQKLLTKHGFEVSMSGKGNFYDNSMVETFFKSIKAELIWRNRWETRRQAEGAIFQYINGFYNPRRRHSSLGGKSPLAFERKAA